MDYSQEFILTDENLPFKLFVFEGGDGNYFREKHWHREIEIFAVFEGCLEFEFLEKSFQLSPGEFVLVNTNEVHSIKSPERNFTIVCQIPLSVFQNYKRDDQLIVFSHDVHEKDEEIMRLLKSMYVSCDVHAAGYDFQSLSLFFRMMYLLVSRYRVEDPGRELIRANKNLERLSVITDYMRQNYAEALSLEGVAGRFSYSPTYVSHMFQKYAGTTFKKYLTSIRLEHAYRSLLHTDDPIGEISLNNGFANVKAMSAAFKGRYGVLPSRLKKGRCQGKESPQAASPNMGQDDKFLPLSE